MKLRLPHIFVISCILLFSQLISATAAFAIAEKYLPGETLDPACTPGEVNCSVEDIWTASSSAVYYVGDFVGIGTTSPEAALSVNSNSDHRVATFISDAVDSYIYVGGTQFSDYALLGARSGRAFFQHASGSYLSVEAQGGGLGQFVAGTLGVGLTNPAYTLDVSGDINYTGTLYNNGTPVSFGGGITSLNGQTGGTQTFTGVDDANIDITIGSASSTHTFTMAWSGVLAAERGGTGMSSMTPNELLISSSDGASWATVSTSSLGFASAISSAIDALEYNNSSGVFSLHNDYDIPLFASTTDWASFFDTPSTRITAGSGLSWSGNTLNATLGGGDSTFAVGNGFIYNGTSSDFVGIGTTSPSEKLSVAGNALIDGVVTASNFVATSTTKSTFPLASTTALTVGSTAYFPSGIWNSSGNVGIGTTTPSEKLVVVGDVNMTGALRFAGNAGTAGYVLQSNGSASPQWVATSSLGISGGSGTVTSVALTTPTGLSVSGSPITSSGTLALSLTSGYVIPLVASTTDWTSFFDTPSTRITAGTGLSWSGNTLNATLGGGDSAFAVGNGFIYNATTSDMVGIGSSTPTATLAIQGSTSAPIRDLFAVASSSGSQYLTVRSNGNVGIGSMTAGSLLFATTSGVIAQDNSNLFWNDTYDGLYLSRSAPTRPAKLLIYRKSTDVQGTVTTTSGSGTVTGSGTIFQTQVFVGDKIVVNGESRTVLSISSDTSLTTDNWTSNNTTQAYSLLFVGAGRVTTTSGSGTVTGTGTAFLQDVAIGDTITVNGETRTVSAIASNTSLTTDNWSASNTTQTYLQTVQRVASVNYGAILGRQISLSKDSVDAGGTVLFSGSNTVAQTSTSTNTNIQATSFSMSTTLGARNTNDWTDTPGLTVQTVNLGTQAGATGTVTNFEGVRSRFAYAATGATITNTRLYTTSLNSNSGIMTNTYGYYVDDITTGTQTNTPYSFYASDANAIGMYSAGKVGIGTTTPTEMLSVAGNALIDGLITTSSINATSTSATSTFSGNLKLSGRLIDGNNASGTLGMVLQSTGTSVRWVATSSLGITGVGGGASSGAAGAIQFSDGASGFSADDTNFFWDNTGKKLGIGTNSPTAAVDVNVSGDNVALVALQLRAGNSSGAVVGNSSSQITFGYNTTDQYRHSIQTNHDGVTSSANTLGFNLWNPDTDAVGDIGTSRVMTLLANGNVGIGTISPAATLSVFSTGANAAIFTGTSTSNRVVIDSVTGSPDAGLQLQENGMAKWSMVSSGGGDFTLYNDALTSSALNVLGSNNNAYFNANLGVGTTTPDSRLTVQGNINFTGTLYQNGLNVAPFILAGTDNIYSSNAVAPSGGSYNLFSGYNVAGAGLSTGDYNVFSGHQAGYGNTSGSDNVFLGRSAGYANTDGYSNIAIGYGADVGSGSLTNATAIGAGAIVSASSSIVLGTTGISVGIGVSAPTQKLETNGTIYSNGSASDSPLAGTAFLFPGGTVGMRLDSSGRFNLDVASTSPVAALTVNQNGNIGLGIADALSKLSVEGAGSFTGLVTGQYFTGTANDLASTFPLASTTAITVANDAYMPGGVWNSSGYVGIGTTTPDLRLAVDGNINFTGTLFRNGIQSNVFSVDGTNNIYSSANTATPTGGSYNIYTGYESAGMGLSTGDYNVFAGFQSGYNNTSGSSNVFIGLSAGTSNQDGGGNTIIGVNANVGSASLSNATAIGSGAVVGASNALVLGDDNVSVGIGVTVPLAQLHTDGTVRFAAFGAGALETDADGNLSVSSDERLKDVQSNFSRGLAEILNINPIRYRWKESTGYDTDNIYTGFSAQNVRLSIPEAVMTDKRGYFTLNDRPITATLVNAVKELDAKINAFKREVVTDRVVTKTLCIEDVCVTKEQLRALLQGQGSTGTAAATTAVTPVTTTTTSTSNSTTSGSTTTTTTSTSTTSTPETFTSATSTPSTSEGTSGGSTTPAPESTPTPEPTPEVTPEPTPTTTSESTPEPAPAPAPAPEPAPAPAPEPAAAAPAETPAQ